MSWEPVENLPGMIGRHPAMVDVYRRVRKLAPSDLPVLIVGETGTGKELVAGAIHDLSTRAGRRFVALNCAALPESLAEAELFGTEAGAYTGAVRRRDGVLSRAHGGTLFLDEVCSMRPEVQAKLLRAIELQEFTRLGGEILLKADFRLVAAVSRSPDTLIAEGTLRRELFHRLGACRLTLPALRDRGDDVLSLAVHFLGPTGKRLMSDARSFLTTYRWPGNVRELRSAMASVAVLVDGSEVTRVHVEAELDGGCPVTGERERLIEMLHQHRWNVAAVAKTLGCGRTKLYALLREHELERPRVTVR